MEDNFKSNIQLFSAKARVVLFGHILNPLWCSRQKRRKIRSNATHNAVFDYLSYLTDFASSLKYPTPSKTTNSRNVFSLWLQGKESAPPLIKACWRSIMENCNGNLQILDSSSILQKTDIPGAIVDKWRSGKIRNAHFADICRVDLLKNHGGMWLDATDFVPQPMGEWIWNEPFFMYLSGNSLTGSYAFVQNCFIRAEQNNPLICGWRDLIIEYWLKRNSLPDYFTHQLLFEFLISNNSQAKALFDKMPKKIQDPTHILWYKYAASNFVQSEFDAICKEALFQKTNYKSELASNPPKGSVAEAILIGNY